MKSKFGKIILIFCLFTSLVINGLAQLSFPKSTNLNLVTNTSILYFETEILFYTGIYKVDDYDAIKVSDSLDSRWFVTACINGECWSNNPDSCPFMKEYGINDTTGFIRFHVDCIETEGTSTIKYLVKNRFDKSDYKLLTFRITFIKNVDIENPITSKFDLKIYNEDGISIFPDFHLDKIPCSLQIFDINGKLLKSIHQPSGDIVLNLEKGIYLLVINEPDQRIYQKIKVKHKIHL